jgi:rRNA maturation endonuclease Nob1
MAEEDEVEQETICCDNCSYEYPRQVGDDCPSCGENNHEQMVRRYG